MCIWLYQRLRKEGCKGLCPACVCVAPLAAVVLAPVGALVGLLAGLALGLVKWIPGSVTRLRYCCVGYCGVISAGAAEYDTEAARVVPPPAREPQSFVDAVATTVETHSRSAGTSCAAEVYCCCVPCFVVSAALLPVCLLVELVVCIGICRGSCSGLSAGCGGCGEFCHRLSRVIETIDIASSRAAFGNLKPWCKYNRVPQNAAPPNLQPNVMQGQTPPIAVAQPVAYAY